MGVGCSVHFLLECLAIKLLAGFLPGELSRDFVGRAERTTIQLLNPIVLIILRLLSFRRRTGLDGERDGRDQEQGLDLWSATTNEFPLRRLTLKLSGQRKEARLLRMQKA
jgi:hypothetical protein